MTDANLVLGYLDPEAGRVLDRDAATAALARLGALLGLDATAAASGVHRVVTARMADAVRVATVRRGVDPRQFRLLSFGGAAGLHGAAVAAELGIPTVVVPWQASVLSAWGMLNTDLEIHLAAGMAQAAPDPAALAEAYAAMEAEGRARLAWFDGPVATRRSADLRYGEQVFEIAAGLDGIDLQADTARAAIEARFHDRHAALFTYAMPDQDVVLTTARLTVTGALPRLPTAMPAHPSPGGTRRIWCGAWVEAPVHGFGDWSGALPGPALIRSATTTVLLRPGDAAVADPRGWLEITVGG